MFPQVINGRKLLASTVIILAGECTRRPEILGKIIWSERCGSGRVQSIDNEPDAPKQATYRGAFENFFSHRRYVTYLYSSGRSLLSHLKQAVAAWNRWACFSADVMASNGDDASMPPMTTAPSA